MDRTVKEHKMIALMVKDLGISDTDEQEMVKVNEEVGALSEEELDRTLAGRLDSARIRWMRKSWSGR